MSDSLIGNLLVASSLVEDPVLARAVCLIVHEDENGYIGVMLNRPLTPNPTALMKMIGDHESMNVEDDANDNLAEDSIEDPAAASVNNRLVGMPDSKTKQALAAATESLGTVHFGGPLSGPVVAIHGASEFAEAETAHGIYVAAQKPNLEGLVREQSGPYRLIVGHVGWEAEQLQAEFDAGFWHMIPATMDAVFASDLEMWPRLVRRATASSVASWIGTPDTPAAFQLN